jgi:catechol 2,3-dioxygenase-like lactoylglutathione lyase family enzyme
MRLELNYYPKGNRFYEPYRPGSELDHLGFAVDDVDGWVNKAKRLGGKIAADFRETAERLAYIRDPDGVWLEFFGAAPPTAPVT